MTTFILRVLDKFHSEKSGKEMLIFNFKYKDKEKEMEKQGVVAEGNS